jgi:hypothetical protein
MRNALEQRAGVNQSYRPQVLIDDRNLPCGFAAPVRYVRAPAASDFSAERRAGEPLAPPHICHTLEWL